MNDSVLDPLLFGHLSEINEFFPNPDTPLDTETRLKSQKRYIVLEIVKKRINEYSLPVTQTPNITASSPLPHEYKFFLNLHIDEHTVRKTIKN